ncbi:telomere length regulation protein TEL2 homolog isoform X2 [Patella vulgata]|nr:telomere length regulation protein TEL2 homolog isoform X2 [Patella vulgata]
MKNLLSVWGDGSAIKHTSYSQHLFISRALMICIGYLNEKEKSLLKEEFVGILMPAVQCHIGSSDMKLRKLGMVVAETLTSTLDPKGPKLHFEFERDVEVYDLLSYLHVPEDTSTQTPEAIPRLEKKDIEPVTCKTTDNPTNLTDDQNTKHNIQTDVELDSDDDLEPYDMSNDVKVTKVKNPKYIRDCMEGLICSDDAERVEACLFSAEQLIRKSPDGLKEIAAEFSKILLHLQNNFSTRGFDAVRFGAMVALAVECPVEVAGYLSSQFYERNYNLRQRMDILEVLSAAAQELAKPVDKNRVRQHQPVKEIKPVKESDDWREIVEKRIEGKTRRFIKGRTQPEPAQVANRFAPVAGHFFFPLLNKVDRSQPSFDLLGKETIVLRKLIYSLGIILHSALHVPLATQMCVNLLEFIWALRYHSDSCIRQALLYATSMVILVLPPFCVLTDLQDVMLETKSWLQETIDNDTDMECKRMALQALVLLENTMQQGFKLDLNDGRA